MDNSNNNEEVKEFTQTVRIAPSGNDDEKDEQIDEEETQTPDSSSEEEKEPEPEEEAADAEESEVEAAEAPKPEPKPVEGETPREKALRLEAVRLKGLLRDQRRDELFVQKPTDSKPNEDLADYDPEEIKKFEKFARAVGFVKKDEIYQQTTQDKLNAEFESFIETHPEYSPEKDPDGVLWNQVKAEFSLYQPPRDPKTLKKVLHKVHNDIFGVQPAKNLNKIHASQEKIKVASHTGASAGKTNIRPRAQAPSGLRIDAMKGFSADEIKELFG